MSKSLGNGIDPLEIISKYARMLCALRGNRQQPRKRYAFLGREDGGGAGTLPTNCGMRHASCA